MHTVPQHSPLMEKVVSVGVVVGGVTPLQKYNSTGDQWGSVGFVCFFQQRIRFNTILIELNSQKNAVIKEQIIALVESIKNMLSDLIDTCASRFHVLSRGTNKARSTF